MCSNLRSESESQTMINNNSNQDLSSQMQSINPNMMQNQMIGGMRMQQPQLVQSMPSQGLHEMGNWQNQGRPGCPNADVELLNPRHESGMATVNQIGQMISEMSIGGTMVRTGMMQRVQSPNLQIGGPGPHLRLAGSPSSAASPLMQQHMPHNSSSSKPASLGLANTSETPMNQFSAPSPGGMVNTPGQPTINMISDYRALHDKVKQWQSKYSDTLEEVAQRIENNDVENIRSLLEVTESLHRKVRGGIKVLKDFEIFMEACDRVSKDRAYHDKVKELQSKYFDILREVAQHFENSDSENARKARNLLEIIESPHRRIAGGMETLKKCELVLERLASMRFAKK